MNEANQWRLKLAQKIVSIYAPNPKVKAGILGGSVARGCADRYSDIDIGIFWSSLPDAQERLVICQQLGGKSKRFNSIAGVGSPRGSRHWESYEIGLHPAMHVEISHGTVNGAEQCLEHVIESLDTDLHSQEFIAIIQYGIPLYGAELIEEWRTKASCYPQELAEKMVLDSFRFFRQLQWQRYYAERGELLPVYDSFVRIAQNILLALMGLNRIYAPSDDWKWMEDLIRQLKITPSNLSNRLRHVFQVDQVCGERHLREIVYDVILLVEEHMPEIDTTEIRACLNSSPRTWENPPEGLS